MDKIVKLGTIMELLLLLLLLLLSTTFEQLASAQTLKPSSPDLNVNKCGPIPLIEHAKRYIKANPPRGERGSPTTTSVDGIKGNDIVRVFYECDEGFNLVGSADLKCNREYLKWDDLPRCVANNTCGPAPQIYDGVIEWQTFSENSGYGDMASYKCDEVYQLNGSPNITCDLDGEWSQIPNCGTPRLFGCGPPPSFALSTILDKSYSDVRKAFANDYVVVGCEPGNVLVDGPSVMTCNGTHWSQPVPYCVPWPESGCGPAPWFENANLTTTSFFNSTARENDYAVYECLSGYFSYGDMAVICGADDRWHGMPDCKKIKACDYPPIIEHGRVSNKDNNTYPEHGTQVTYTCFNHFEMKGEATITCLKNLTWSQTPTCTENDNYNCPAIEPVQNGIIATTTVSTGVSPKPGDSVKFKCAPGYRMIGPAIARCLVSLRWSAQPICAPAQANSRLTLIDSALIQSRVTTTTAKPDTNLFCRQPSNYSNAVVIGKSWGKWQAIKSGDMIVYECMSGYQRVAKSSKALLCSGGEWLGWIECEPAPYSCEPPYPVDHTTIVERSFAGNRALTGDSVSYVCHSGYQLKNTYSIKRLTDTRQAVMALCRDGMWTNLPVCHPQWRPRTTARCQSAPPPINNGEIKAVTSQYQDGPFETGHFVIFQCNKGYTLPSLSIDTDFPSEDDPRRPLPTKVVSCGPDGTWSPPPGCIKVPKRAKTCGPMPRMDKNTIVITAEGVVGSPPTSDYLSRVNDYLMVDCAVGFELIGQDKIVCQRDGSWSKTPNCSAVTCGLLPKDPPHASNRFRTFTNLSNVGDFALYRCRSGYRLTNMVDRITCKPSGNWSSPAPRCERIVPPRRDDLPIVTCRMPVPIPTSSVITYSSFGGQYDPFGEPKAGDFVVYTCPDGYTVMGNSTVSCLPGGRWTVGPECRIVGSGSAEYSGGIKRGPQCLKSLQTKDHTSCLDDSYDLLSLRPINIKAILDEHNMFRKNVTPKAEIMGNLTWDAELALSAERWAAQCTTANDNAAKRSMPQKGMRWIGQNIYGSATLFNPAVAVNSWARERHNWKYGVGATKAGAIVGHYTQVIWGSTLYVGCGMSQCNSVNNPLSFILVCNYGPGGNTAFVGQNPFARPYVVHESYYVSTSNQASNSQ